MNGSITGVRRPRRLRLWVVLVALLGLLSGAGVGLWKGVPQLADRFLIKIATRVEAFLGHDITWSAMQFHRYDRIELFDVTVARRNGPDAEPILLRIDRVDVHFQPQSVLTGKLRLTRVDIDNPRTHLVRYPDGTDNYTELRRKLAALLRRGRGDGESTDSPFRYLARSLPRLRVQGAEATVDDRSGKGLVPGLTSLHLGQGWLEAVDESPVQDELDLRFEGDVRVAELDNGVHFTGRFSYPDKDLDLSLSLARRLEYELAGRPISVGGLAWDLGRDLRLTDVVVGAAPGTPEAEAGQPAVRIRAVALAIGDAPAPGMEPADLSLPGGTLGKVLRRITSITLIEPELLVARYADRRTNFTDLTDRLEGDADGGEAPAVAEPEEVAAAAGRAVAPAPAEKDDVPGARFRRGVVRLFTGSETAFRRLSDLVYLAGSRLPVREVAIRKGTIRYQDEVLFDADFRGEFENFDLTARRLADAPVLDYEVSFETGRRERRGANRIKGRIDLVTRDVQLSVAIETLSLEPYKALFPASIPVDHGAELHHTRLDLVYSREKDAAQIEGQVHVRGLPFQNRLLASQTLTGMSVGVEFTGSIDLGRHDLKLDKAKLSLGQTPVLAEGTVLGYGEYPKFDLRFRMADTPVQHVIDSLPRELIPALEGLQARGTLSWKLDVRLDTKDLATLDYESTPLLQGFEVTDMGKRVDFRLIRGPFRQRVPEPDGSVYEFTTGPGTGSWVYYDGISPWMTAVVTTTEDGNFFRHSGISTNAIKESLIQNMTRGGFIRGASTISQQLVKNLFLTREKTISRKLQEMFITWQLEQRFTKEEILELYFNVIEFGPRLYGIRRAAEHYFGKSPAELTLLDCIFLASIIPNPKKYHYQFERGQVTENWRTKLEFFGKTMLKRGKISEDDYRLAAPFTPWFKGQPPPPSTLDPGDLAPDGDFLDNPDAPREPAGDPVPFEELDDAELEQPDRLAFDPAAAP